jgi:hypothetical protein
VARTKSRKARRPSRSAGEHPAIEVFVQAMLRATVVGKAIEEMDPTTGAAVIARLAPFADGRVALDGNPITREDLSHVAVRHGTIYARLVLIAVLLFSRDLGGQPAQSRVVEEIYSSRRSPDEVPQLTEDLDRLMAQAPNLEGMGLAKVFLPELVARSAAEITHGL